MRTATQSSLQYSNLHSLVLGLATALGATACGSSGDSAPKANVALSGASQKGPFVLGSSITVSTLDADGNPTGATFETQTTSGVGEFELKLPSDAWVTIEGSGFYFNELSGELSAAPIVLRAQHVVASADTDSAFVNIITHLSAERVRTLVGAGATIAEAGIQAELELVAALDLPAVAPDTKAVDMDMLGGSNRANAYVLIVSAVFTKLAQDRSGAIDAELQQLLNTTAIEFAASGSVNANLLQQLEDAIGLINWKRVAANLERRATELGLAVTVPDVSQFLDQDRDGIVDATDNCLTIENPSQDDTNSDGVGDACAAQVCAEPGSFNYVLNSLTVPATATQAQNLALDIDGDGINENAFGGLLGALGSTANWDLQTPTDEQVVTGDFVQLLSLESSSVASADVAQICSYKGENPSITPCTNSSNLATCGRHLTGSVSFDVAADSPSVSAMEGSIAANRFESEPDPILPPTTFVALSFSRGMPVVLPLAYAKISATTLEASLSEGVLAGGLSGDTVETIVLPALAAAIQGEVATSCTPSSGDCGCAQDGSGEELLNFFDSNGDCAVPVEELRENALIGATLRNPDLDLIDAEGNPGNDGVMDHLSIGLGFTAISANL